MPKVQGSIDGAIALAQASDRADQEEVKLAIQHLLYLRDLPQGKRGRRKKARVLEPPHMGGVFPRTEAGDSDMQMPGGAPAPIRMAQPPSINMGSHGPGDNHHAVTQAAAAAAVAAAAAAAGSLRDGDDLSHSAATGVDFAHQMAQEVTQ